MSLGQEVGFAQELPWQREFRYQAWSGDFEAMVDVTFDEGRPLLWRGIAEGYQVIFDREDVTDWLAGAVTGWEAPIFDAEVFDVGTWPWLAYLDNHLRKGDYWMVRSGLYDTLNSRIVRLLGAEADNA